VEEITERSRARDEIQENTENRDGGPFSLARSHGQSPTLDRGCIFFALLCSSLFMDQLESRATFAKSRYRKSNLHMCDALYTSANTDSGSARRATRTMHKPSSDNCRNDREREREREREPTRGFSRKPEGNIFPVPSILSSSHQYRCDLLVQIQVSANTR